MKLTERQTDALLVAGLVGAVAAMVGGFGGAITSDWALVGIGAFGLGGAFMCVGAALIWGSL